MAYRWYSAHLHGRRMDRAPKTIAIWVAVDAVQGHIYLEENRELAAESSKLWQSCGGEEGRSHRHVTGCSTSFAVSLKAVILSCRQHTWAKAGRQLLGGSRVGSRLLAARELEPLWGFKIPGSPMA